MKKIQKKYHIDKIYVVEIEKGNEPRIIFCLGTRRLYGYKAVFTGEIIWANPWARLGQYVYRYEILKDKRYLTEKELFQIWQDMNEKLQEKLVQKELKQQPKQIKKEDSKPKQEKPIENVDVNKMLELEAQNFFPKTGGWWSSCFYMPTELRMQNLPCNLRDSEWLARMFREKCNLYDVNFYDVLEFVKNSKIFNELRHNYELEIVKWQINWIKNGGEGWITDEKLGGDCVFFSEVCDLGFRKGVLDTLLAIGMNKEVIEEGLEKYSDLWRNQYISSAFWNKYNCIFFLADPNVPVPEIDKEHQEAWIRYRKYQYYQTHKKMVDKYGKTDEDMLMDEDEALRLKCYLESKHKERIYDIETYKKQALGKGRVHSLEW